MTRTLLNTIFLFAGLSCIFFSCKNPVKKIQQAPKYAADDFPSTDDTIRTAKIIWDKKEQKVSHEEYFAEYGRAKRYHGDTVILVYHFGPKGHEWDNIAMRKSFNNGRNWNPMKMIVIDDQQKRYSGFSTPDLLVLKNKWLLLAYTGRGIPDDSVHNNLQVRISKDAGETWSPPNIVALGRSWEPGMVQLPNGEIQLFFSNEILSTKAAKGRHEQKVMMITSKNNGHTWTDPKTVAFTPGRRDGMPVPLVLQDHKGIIIPVEAVENATSPEIIWSSEKANWNYKGMGDKVNGRRWVGTVDPVWGGAPCIVQMPGGETVISMQTELGRKLDRYRGWKKNSVVVMVGNSMAKNFGSLSFPYPDLPISEGRYFNSLFVVDKNRVALITTRNYPDSSSAVFWKEGRILKTSDN
jgi:hypothetical protein